jgi:hypothetical protein
LRWGTSWSQEYHSYLPGSAKTVIGLSIAVPHAAKSMGKINATNGARRMDPISGLVQNEPLRKLEPTSKA